MARVSEACSLEPGTGRLGRLGQLRRARLRSYCAGALGLALAASSGCERSTGPSDLALDPQRPPIILITLDTTRRDRLGCYGYRRETSPSFDRFCAEATRFDRAYSTTSWTLPAHASLFTGKYTHSHGARYDAAGPLVLGDVIDHGRASRYRARGLAEGERTLAAALADAGYATGGFVAGPWMKRVFGLDAGFEHWDDDGIDEENGRRAEAVTDRALAWLGENASRPVFAFLNYYDPHSPYSPPEGWRDRFTGGAPAPPQGAPMTLEQANQLYDAEILYTDHHLGRLFDQLRAWGLYDAAWIVVTADHGDVIGEHGTAGHGRYLWEEEIRIPLVVKRPAGVGAGTVDGEAIQLNDLMPWLLGELGLDVPEQLGGPRSRGDDAILVELYPLPVMFAKGDWRVLIEGSYKYVWNSKGRHKLHDLRRRGAEDENLMERVPDRFEVMDERLVALLGSLPTPLARRESPDFELEASTQRALQGLGYLGGDQRDGDQRDGDESDGSGAR
jgi:arylsulfatase A-like enzyme